ncbi:MAG: hypothetical protein GYA48_00935 [Chloroflexi bacterium]|nr:hypothetical protein [Chloroflexota bacterium]
MANKKRWGLFYLLLLLLASACARDPYEQVSTRHRVSIDDASFSPRQWKVPAGEEITFEAQNQAARDLEFTILTTNLELPLRPQDAEMIWFTTPLPSDQEVQFTFQSPSMPGEYDVLLDATAATGQEWLGKLVVYSPEELK